MITRTTLAALFLLSSITAAEAQSIGGNASISATSTSSSVQLPANTIPYPFVIIAPAAGVSTEIFYALGGSSVVAVANTSPALPPAGICLNVGPNSFVAAITSGTAAVRITQLSVCPPSF
jgi:hypothetical protein